MARPSVISDERRPELARQIEELGKIQCQWKEISAVLGFNEDTLKRHFEDEYLKGKEIGKTSLRRQMFKVAMSGNTTMCIWLSKQLLGYTDKQEQTVVQQNNKEIVTSLIEEIKSLGIT